MKLFISYRRKDWSFARSLAEKLREYLAAEIFIDFDAIDEPDFDASIMRNLRTSDVFLLIVSENTFAERIFRKADWLHREIFEALTLNIPIICAFINGQYVPEDLPEDILLIRHMQGISFHPEFFDAGVARLADFLIDVTPIEPRELTAEERYIRDIKQKSRRQLLAALRALENDDHATYVDLLRQARALYRQLPGKKAAPSKPALLKPPLADLPLLDDPDDDETLASYATESITESVELEWLADHLPPANLPENPLRIAEDAAQEFSAGKSVSQIVGWLYPLRPPAENAP